MTETTVTRKVKGTFSNLPFEGVLIGMNAQCLNVQVENPHKNLPAVTTADGVKNVLTFHPLDKNVKFEIETIEEKSTSIDNEYHEKIMNLCDALSDFVYQSEMSGWEYVSSACEQLYECAKNHLSE